MLDAILIVLLIKIRSNYKQAGESGASRYILPVVGCIVAAILLVLAGGAEESGALLFIGLLFYIPAFIVAVRGFKKSKRLAAEACASGVRSTAGPRTASAPALPENLRALAGTAAPSQSGKVIRVHTCPNCGSEKIRPLGARGARGTSVAVAAAFGAVGNLAAQRSASGKMSSLPIEYKCGACRSKFLVYPEQAERSELLPRPAVVLLTRRSGMLGAAVARFILLNGEKVGTVKNNRSVSFQTNVLHNELLILDQYDATADQAPLRFDVSPGETVQVFWNGKNSVVTQRYAEPSAPQPGFAGDDPFTTVSADALSRPAEPEPLAMPVFAVETPVAKTEDAFAERETIATAAETPEPDAAFFTEPVTAQAAEEFAVKAPPEPQTEPEPLEEFAPQPAEEPAIQPAPAPAVTAPEPAPEAEITPEPEPKPAAAAKKPNGFCNRCGTPLKPEAVFCHVCGATVRRGVRPEA